MIALITCVAGLAIILPIMATGPTSKEYNATRRHDRDPY